MLNSRNNAVLTALLSAAGLLPMNAMADISFAEGGEQLINTLHTHLYSPSSGLSSFNEFQIASVCFISDTKNCSDDIFGYDLNDAERCRKEGYTLTSCAAGETPEGFCIYNHNYFARCVCPAGYKICEEPYYGVGTACGDKYASCACTPCGNGYDYTSVPSGYVADGEGCLDCDGITKYKVKINPCDGFLDCGSMGGASGAKTCQSGNTIKYDNCNACPYLGTYTSCPSPYTCAYEECSNRYYKTGCQPGYDWDASTQTCTSPCDSSYRYTCTGSYEIPYGSSCNGRYTSCNCQSPYSWSGSQCEISCDFRETWDGTQCVCDQTYYPYTCTGSNESPIGESCNGMYMECSCPDGYGWFNGSCNLCENKLSEGWTYDATQCPYGVTDTETGSVEECYRTKYKCSGCKLSELEIGSPFDFGPTLSDKGAIVEINVINQATCSFSVNVLTNVETRKDCYCNKGAIILHPLSLYTTVFNNKSKIDATMTSLSKPTISTEYPYRSGETSYPQNSFEGVAGQFVLGTFNMATGSEENSVVCHDGCSFPFGNPTLYSNNLIIKGFNCRGEKCN